MLDEILKSIELSIFYEDPFPHLVFHNFLPIDVYQKLNLVVPEQKEFNHSRNLLQDESAWTDYVSAVTHPEFHKSLLRKLGANWSFENHDVGLRGRDRHTKYVAEAYFAIRKPSGASEFLLPPHVDSRFAITSLVHYFRDFNDDDNSGSLLLFKETSRPLDPLNGDSIIDYYSPESFDSIREIPYVGNVAICMLCLERSWHGISPRQRNIRRSMNISLEFQNDGNRKKSSDETRY